MKLSTGFDTPIYTFSKHQESSTPICMCSRKFAALNNYLDSYNIHGVKAILCLRARCIATSLKAFPMKTCYL